MISAHPFNRPPLSSSFHHCDISSVAYSHVLKCIAIGGDFWDALRDVLLLGTYTENLTFFYRIVYPLSYVLLCLRFFAITHWHS